MRIDYAAPLSACDEVVIDNSSEHNSENGVVRFEIHKKISADDSYLPGHYPGFVIYPGVFTVESVHQGAREVLARTRPGSGPVRLTAIRSVRFRNLLLPGDTLRAVCELTPSADTDGLFRVKARCERADGTPTGTVDLEVSHAAPGPARVDETPPTEAPGARSLGFDRIAGLLPHRHPIVQVDRVLEIDPGRAIVAAKAVTAAEPCYAHVPAGAPADHYDYPLTLLFESMGQSGGVLWLHGQEEGADDSDALIFGGARNCRSLGPVRPGDVMRHVVRTEMLKGDNAVMSGSTWVGDRCVATVDTMIAVVRPRADLVGGRTG